MFPCAPSSGALIGFEHACYRRRRRVRELGLHRLTCVGYRHASDTPKPSLFRRQAHAAGELCVQQVGQRISFHARAAHGVDHLWRQMLKPLLRERRLEGRSCNDESTAATAVSRLGSEPNLASLQRRKTCDSTAASKPRHLQPRRAGSLHAPTTAQRWRRPLQRSRDPN